MTDSTWREDALCVLFAELTGDHDMWFRPEDTYESEYASEMCFSCPVRETCLKEACDQGVKEGVWGGLPASTRRKAKHDYATLIDLPNPYATENRRSPHHAEKLRHYDPETDDDQ